MNELNIDDQKMMPSYKTFILRHFLSADITLNQHFFSTFLNIRHRIFITELMMNHLKSQLKGIFH